MPTLPDHAQIIASSDVWMETAAIDQLSHVANCPCCLRAVGMPDLHPGRGIPVGAAFAFDGEIRPTLVGGDAGCGVLVIGVPAPRRRGDALVKRVDKLTQKPIFDDCDPLELVKAVWDHGPRGLLEVDWVPEGLVELVETFTSETVSEEDDVPSGPMPQAIIDGAEVFARQLGTVGGGNHFLEISAVTEIVSDRASQAGLVEKGGAIIAHSGSRGLGGIVGRAWAGQILSDAETQARYRGELLGAVRYARANRWALVWRALDAMGNARPDRVGGWFDVVHNHVQPARYGDAPVWLHRKGAAPADAGTLTAVLGSRGAPTWVMEGAGQAESLCSVAHGAGRRMGRGEATAKLKQRFKRADLRRTALGGRVICDNAELLYEEHPKAYKAIEPVVVSLEAAGAATRVAALTPQITVKR
ncbi:MAG: RtcB family protein [Bradymonadia bacterium]